MATFLEPSEKGDQVSNLRQNTYLAYGENLVKRGPVDPKFSLLKCLFKKKKLTQTEHSPRGMYTARAKNRVFSRTYRTLRTFGTTIML